MTAPVRAPNASNDSAASMSTLQQSTVDDAIAGWINNTPDANTPPDPVEEYAQVGNFPTSGSDRPAKREDKKEEPKASKALKDDEAGVEGEAEVPVEEEAVVEAEAPKGEPRKLATDLKLIDKDGDELDVNDVLDKVPFIEFKAHGVVRREPLDKVVRLAQSGVYNEKMYTEAKDAIEKYAGVETNYQTVAAKLAKQNEFVQQLLENDAFRDSVKERWAGLNTPEARAERAERRIAELEAQRTGQSQTDSVASFVEKDVAAPIKALLQQFPALTEAEVVGHFTALTAKYGPVIPPDKYADIRTIIQHDLPAWAASVSDARTAEKSALRKAQETNTLLKKRLAQGARPIGRRVMPGEATTPKREPRTQDERIAAAVEEALNGI